MRIHLLMVPSLGLEVRREGLIIHEPGASDDTNGCTLGEDIQSAVYFQARSIWFSVVDG